ncbi:hypothetical protein VPHD479_0183 [Vibrio phage D479]
MDFIDDLHKTHPEEKHWVIIEKLSGKERTIPEAILKQRFDADRWTAITSGTDRYFMAYEYNLTSNERTFNLQ